MPVIRLGTPALVLLLAVAALLGLVIWLAVFLIGPGDTGGFAR